MGNYGDFVTTNHDRIVLEARRRKREKVMRQLERITGPDFDHWAKTTEDAARRALTEHDLAESGELLDEIDSFLTNLRSTELSDLDAILTQADNLANRLHKLINEMDNVLMGADRDAETLTAISRYLREQDRASR